MRNKIYVLNLVLMISIFTFAHRVQAIDYYVDQNHPNANDQNTGTEEQPWKTITKANQTLTAGDTVYIKAGSYTNYIAPNNSGTSDSNRITYRNYGTDTVTIQNAQYGIHLNGDDYITVQGINFYNLDRFMFIENGADYNIVANCSFDQMRNLASWRGSAIWKNSNYNWIHDNQFSKYGYCSGGDDVASVFEISWDDGGSTYYSNHNLVENNVFFHGGHHAVGIHGRYNVFRNNYVYNNAWSNGAGNRTLYMVGKSDYAGYNLIENNRFGYADPPCDSNGVSGLNMASHHNIFRYNATYHHNLASMTMSCYSGTDASYNAVYNNTFFNSGNDDVHYNDNYHVGIRFSHTQSGCEVKNNKIKNNLFYSHVKLYGTSGASLNDQTFANNFGNDNDSIDPLFVNASTNPPVDKTDSSLPNLNLQDNSPAINAGGALTTATSSGNSSTNLTVGSGEACYFQDGKLGLASEIDADWIAVGTVGNTVQISSISGDTITLASPISWNNGDSVWLYKDSDGTVVLYGSAPDAGAYEFSRAGAPSPPRNLRIASPNLP